MSERPGSVVIVGGGVIGAACAHYLNESAWAVTVVDQGQFGRGCSHANCGFVCPSHVLPLAEPGAVKQALSSMVRRDSPLKVKFRFDPALWAWLWKFARRCNQPDMLAAGRACHALLERSMTLYERLIEREALDCEWQRRGLLYVYRDEAAWDAYGATDRLMREHFGVGARRVDRRELRGMEPALNDELAGGWHHEHDAHLRPDKLMAAWRETLLARGVELLEDCRVDELRGRAGRAESAVTSAGTLSADAFVVAAGALTPQFGRAIGATIPIQPGKGYSITMPRPSTCPQLPLIFPQHRVAVTPMQSAYRLGSMMEFSGYDSSLPERRLQVLKRAAELYLREPYCEPVLERWFGWRPMTYDGVPIIDRSPRWSNVLLAAGHNMLGLSMAPATGELVAQQLGGHPPTLDPTLYRLSRFAARA